MSGKMGQVEKFSFETQIISIRIDDDTDTNTKADTDTDTKADTVSVFR